MRVRTRPPALVLLSDRKRLGVVLAVTTAYFLAEVIGGFYTGSLALLSDAVHMLTDIMAICLSLLALWISTRPATGAKTYGYLRAEILGALLNGLFLWVVVVFIIIEASRRLRDPPLVAGIPMMGIAVIGIIVNSFSAFMTSGERRGIAVRAVFVHVLSDLIGSAGVLAAGALVYFTEWRRADPVVSIFISLLIAVGSWVLIKDGIDILMEATPSNINIEELRTDLLSIGGTREVHDLHVWCLASHELALSAHAVMEAETDSDRLLNAISELLEKKFNIRHITVQLERDSRRDLEPVHF